MKRLLIVIAALAFSASAAAQAYKWRDSNGRTRYGDIPPPGVNATPIRGPASAPPPPPPAAQAKKADARDDKNEKSEKNEKPLTPEEAFRKRQEERKQAEEKAAKEQAQAAQKRANCEQARTQLRTLQSGIRVSTVNAAGERVFMDDEARARAAQSAQKAVADWCN